MKFNTQVCTTRDQSERLIALGLKKDTADMYLTRCFVGNNGTPMIFIGTTHKPSTVLFSKEDIPAWTLHRLIALCPKMIVCHQSEHEMSLSVTHNGAYYEDNFTYPTEEIECFDLSQNLYDNLIDCIEWLIKENHFNKQYLNESL